MSCAGHRYVERVVHELYVCSRTHRRNCGACRQRFWQLRSWSDAAARKRAGKGEQG